MTNISNTSNFTNFAFTLPEIEIPSIDPKIVDSCYQVGVRIISSASMNFAGAAAGRLIGGSIGAYVGTTLLPGIGTESGLLAGQTLGAAVGSAFFSGAEEYLAQQHLEHRMDTNWALVYAKATSGFVTGLATAVAVNPAAFSKLSPTALKAAKALYGSNDLNPEGILLRMGANLSQGLVYRGVLGAASGNFIETTFDPMSFLTDIVAGEFIFRGLHCVSPIFHFPISPYGDPTFVSASTGRSNAAHPSTRSPDPMTTVFSVAATSGAPQTGFPKTLGVLINKRVLSARDELDEYVIRIPSKTAAFRADKPYQPGDCLAIYPKQDPAYVDELLGSLYLNGAEQITKKGQTMSLRDWLISGVECHWFSYSKPVQTFPDIVCSQLPEGHPMKTARAAYASFAKAKGDLKTHMEGKTILQVVTDFREAGTPLQITGQQLVDSLPDTSPKLYTILNSVDVGADGMEITLMVKHVKGGLSTSYLRRSLPPHEEIKISHSTRPAYKPPTDPNAEVFFFGPGAGWAGFGVVAKHEGPITAFTGYRNRLENGSFPYANEMKLNGGKCHVAISGDVAGNAALRERLSQNSGTTIGQRLRAFDLMWNDDDSMPVTEQTAGVAKRIYNGMMGNAVFRVCGMPEMYFDKHNPLAPCIRNNLKAILIKFGEITDEAAERFVKDLEETKRIQTDLYNS